MSEFKIPLDTLNALIKKLEAINAKQQERDAQVLEKARAIKQESENARVIELSEEIIALLVERKGRRTKNEYVESCFKSEDS